MHNLNNTNTSELHGLEITCKLSIGTSDFKLLLDHFRLFDGAISKLYIKIYIKIKMKI
jgi:hypothetical protein